MKITDKLKEEIGLHKLVMTIASAISSSLIAWLFNNIATEISTVRLVLVAVVTAILLIITFVSFINIKTQIKELEYE